MNESSETFKITMCICIAITIIILGIVGGVHFTNRIAINKGLCKGSLPGAQGTYWVACK